MPTNTQARRRLFGRGERRVGDFAMIQPQRAKASSAALHKVDEVAKDMKRRIGDEWQSEAYTYAETIGEVGYVVSLTADTLAQADFVAQQRAEDGSWGPTGDERVRRVMDCFVGPQGGQRELKRRAALHLTIAGETILVGSTDEDGLTQAGIFWEFLSTDEIRVMRGQPPTRKRDGGMTEQLPTDAYVARCWKSSPRYSELADSSVKRVLKVCNEILTLGDMIDAIARSRLAAGILAVPEEITFVGDDESEEDLDTDLGGIDRFVDELFEHLSSPITDRTSAASLVPLVVRGPADVIDKITLIDVARDLDTWAQSLRQECLTRLAAGMDVDPAIIEGLGTANHWSSAQISHEFATKHIRPVGELLADFVTHSYMRPMLETFEEVPPEESRLFRLVFDTANLTARADEAMSARVLHEMQVLSDSSLLRSNGFDASDEPTPDELSERRAWILLRSAPVQLGPVLGPLCGFGDLDWSAAQQPPGGMPGMPPVNGGLVLPAGAQLPSTPNGTAKKVEAIEGRLLPRDAESAQEVPKTPVPGFTLVERLAVACDSALERAFERAGARLLTKAKRDLTLRDRVSAVDKNRVLTLVRPTELDRLDLPPNVLFDGAWDSLAQKARGWVRAYLVECGRSQLVADDTAALGASELCDRMQSFAAERLHRPLTPLESGLRVPERLVVEALASAGVL